MWSACNFTGACRLGHHPGAGCVSQPLITARLFRKSWWASGASETQPDRPRDPVVEHQKNGLNTGAMPRSWLRSLSRVGVAASALALTVGSAILVKESQQAGVPLPMVETVASAATPRVNQSSIAPTTVVTTNVASHATHIQHVMEATSSPSIAAKAHGSDASHRWFNGRPVRPARTMTMVVTAYSPDARSCGKYADGKTATLHSVKTNGGNLVAADPRVLPYGSMISVPGYDDANIVPVLDCGSAIKGRRLDLLFPTHEQARQWGRKTVTVTIWEYADGLPPDNPRRLR